jgi:hypothetical protein
MCEEEHSEASRRARTRKESEDEASSALLERKSERVSARGVDSVSDRRTGNRNPMDGNGNPFGERNNEVVFFVHRLRIRKTL